MGASDFLKRAMMTQEPMTLDDPNVMEGVTWTLNQIADLSSSITRIAELVEGSQASQGLSGADNMHEEAINLGEETASAFLAFLNNEKRVQTVSFQSLALVYSCVGSARSAKDPKDLYVLLMSALMAWLR